MAADISSVLQIQMLAGIAIQTLGGLDGVVNNAGMLGPKGLVEQTDPGDWMDTLQTNLLGPVMLCQAVLPLFRRRGYGKIVNLSGGGATAPMPRLSAYAASKAALVRFTETLAEETRGSGIDVNAVAPGALRTRMTKEAVEAGPKAVGADFFERMKKVQSEGGAPLEDAAALCAFLLSSASDGITGKLISAVWDNWQLLPERRGGLDASDVYTLRRIVPRDRGLDWE
jgi:3-oxoacyl-[acyl-carrier protein] reductase